MPGMAQVLPARLLLPSREKMLPRDRVLEAQVRAVLPGQMGWGQIHTACGLRPWPVAAERPHQGQLFLGGGGVPEGVIL